MTLVWSTAIAAAYVGVMVVTAAVLGCLGYLSRRPSPVHGIETGSLSISVCHFPPGTSKSNQIEHRLFSFISSNWRGEPLRDYETIVNLIAKATIAKGLPVKCRIDRRKYPTGRKVSKQEMERVNWDRNKFHGDWNYVIKPTRNA